VASANAAANALTVLVAGGVDGASDGLREALRREGFRTLLVRDGRQALDVMGRRSPDAVLLEASLPEVTGLEVLEAMSRDPQVSRVPVLMMGAQVGEADMRRAIALGARRWMSLPLDVPEVVAEVRRQMSDPLGGAGRGAF